MPGPFKIQWRIREDVEAASHNWHDLNTFFKLEEMHDAFDRLTKTGQIEFRKVIPEAPKPKEEKESFFKANNDEKSNRTGNPVDNNRTGESLSEKESRNRSQLPLL